MDVIVGIIIAFGAIIAVKWWWSYLSMWYRSVEGFKLMVKLGGEDFAKNMNLGKIMKKAAEMAEKKKKNSEDDMDNEDEVMYQ